MDGESSESQHLTTPKSLEENSEKIEPAKIETNQIVTVILLMVAFAFARTAVFVQLLATSLAAKTFIEGSASTSLSTIPLAFLYYGATLVAPFASKFMAIVGRQMGFIVGCLMGVLGASIAVLSTYLHAEEYSTFWVHLLVLTIGTLFLGFANGFVNFFRFAAADALPQRKSLAISVVLFGGDLAALMGPSIADWTRSLVWEYGACYMSLMILFLCSIFVLLFIDVPALGRPNLSNLAPPRSLGELLKIPRLLLALSTATIGFGMMVLLMVLVPLVMEDGFDLGETSHVLQIHSVGMFAPGPIVGFLIEKVGVLAVDSAGMIFLMGASLVMIIGQNYWNYLLGMLFLGVGWNFTFISSTTMLTETYLPSEKATTQGVNDFVMYFIVSSLSLASAPLWHLLGSWANVNYLALGVSSVGLLLIVALFLYERFNDSKEIPLRIQ